jgi:hypothetical protein
MALGVIGLLLALKLAHRRARRRPSLDKYANIPPVTVIPNRRA